MVEAKQYKIYYSPHKNQGSRKIVDAAIKVHTILVFSSFYFMPSHLSYFLIFHNHRLINDSIPALTTTST